MIPEWPLSFWPRMGLLVVLLCLVAGLEWLFRRSQATRWREYLFLLGVLAGGAAFGIAVDQVTSRISLEYFLHAKALPPDQFGWELVNLGAKAGITASAFAGGAFLIANSFGKQSKPVRYRILLGNLRYPILGATLAAAVLGLVFYGLVPNEFLGRYQEILLEEELAPFRIVVGAHYGLYLGGVIGTVVGVGRIRRARAKHTLGV